jgi:hypothetical protein
MKLRKPKDFTELKEQTIGISNLLTEAVIKKDKIEIFNLTLLLNDRVDRMLRAMNGR